MFFSPLCLISQHGIEDGHHLAHTGRERNFFVFSVCHESLVGHTDDRIMLNRRQHGLEQDGTDTGPTTTNTTFTTMRTTVSNKRINGV